MLVGVGRSNLLIVVKSFIMAHFPRERVCLCVMWVYSVQICVYVVGMYVLCCECMCVYLYVLYVCVDIGYSIYVSVLCVCVCVWCCVLCV